MDWAAMAVRDVVGLVVEHKKQRGIRDDSKVWKENSCHLLKQGEL